MKNQAIQYLAFDVHQATTGGDGARRARSDPAGLKKD
jgi:hypothetical protein